jgi:hypothetical protein
VHGLQGLVCCFGAVVDWLRAQDARGRRRRCCAVQLGIGAASDVVLQDRRAGTRKRLLVGIQEYDTEQFISAEGSTRGKIHRCCPQDPDPRIRILLLPPPSRLAIAPAPAASTL